MMKNSIYTITIIIIIIIIIVVTLLLTGGNSQHNKHQANVDDDYNNSVDDDYYNNSIVDILNEYNKSSGDGSLYANYQVSYGPSFPVTIFPYSNLAGAVLLHNVRVKDGMLFEYLHNGSLLLPHELLLHACNSVMSQAKTWTVKNEWRDIVDHIQVAPLPPTLYYYKHGYDDFKDVEVTFKSVLVVDLFAGGYQFGHATNACAQLASWLVETRKTYDLVVMLKAQKSLFSRHSLLIVAMLERMTNITLIYGHDWNSSMAIYSSVTYLEFSEVPFMSALSSKLWREAATKMFKLDPAVMHAACPVNNTIMLLGRHEAKRDARVMLNMPKVSYTLKVNAPPCYLRF